MDSSSRPRSDSGHAYNSVASTIFTQVKRSRVQFLVDSTPGRLALALGILSKKGINCTRIESQPEAEGIHAIYVEVSGDELSPEVLEETRAQIASEIPGSTPRVMTSSSSVPWFPRRMRDLDTFAAKVMSFGEELDADHPGFKDDAYRARRKAIVENAKKFRTGMALPVIEYTEEEVATWRVVYTKVMELLPTHACREHRAVFPLLEQHCGFGPDRIPQLHEVSEFLQQSTGFRLRPVMGLLSSRDFLNGLAFRVFHATQYIRHHSKPLYTPEPDVCHELLGHAPLLADPAFAEFSQEIGLASLGATDDEIVQLSSVYWFTVEFGLCQEASGVKAFGAGLLSSFGELEYSVDSETPERVPFDPRVAACTPYPITTYQPKYFVAESFKRATEQIRAYARTLHRPFEVVYDAYTQRMRIINTQGERTFLARQIEKLSGVLASSFSQE